MSDQRGRCAGRFRSEYLKAHAKAGIVIGVFVVLFAVMYFINSFLDFSFGFFFYILLFFSFVSVCSCFQNICQRLDKQIRKCFRRVTGSAVDTDGTSHGQQHQQHHGANSSSVRITPVAWQEWNTNHDRVGYGPYTHDQVLQLPSLGQMEDTPPSYDDVISSDPLPPSYEEATKAS